MNEKFNKNAKVEQLIQAVLSHGEEKGLIVKDPLKLFLLSTERNINEFAAGLALLDTWILHSATLYLRIVYLSIPI